MATARDIISDALWIAKIVPLGVTPKAKELSFGLTALNDMLAAWAIDGLNLNQATLTESSTPTFSAAFMRGVKFNLALEMAGGPFGGEISPFIVESANAQKALIRANLFTLVNLSHETALTSRWLANDYYA